jgi:hypothetical protein
MWRAPFLTFNEKREALGYSRLKRVTDLFDRVATQDEGA